jgi:DNA-directed RNA polymerase specialized sigma54-like protein
VSVRETSSATPDIDTIQVPGCGFGYYAEKESTTQGTRVDLVAYYKSLATQEQELKNKAAAMGVPVQKKKTTRNTSNVAMGDPYFFAGRHMFETSNQASYPDLEKKRRAAMPIQRVDYGAVEVDAAKEIANMIMFKSHGQFSDMQKAFLEYDKDRSGTLDRDELAQICHRFHLGNGDERVIQALIDLVDSDGSGVISYDEFANKLGSHMRSDEFEATEGHNIRGAHQ